MRRISKLKAMQDAFDGITINGNPLVRKPDHDREGITVNGVPLSDHVEKLERNELVDVINEETFAKKKTIYRGKGGVKIGTPLETTQPISTKKYTEPERFEYLLNKGEDDILKRNYLTMHTATKYKLHTIYALWKILPKKFITSDVMDNLRNRGYGDPRRFLRMVVQANLFSGKEAENGTIVYNKIVTDEVEAVTTTVSRVEHMCGYGGPEIYDVDNQNVEIRRQIKEVTDDLLDQITCDICDPVEDPTISLEMEKFSDYQELVDTMSSDQEKAEVKVQEQTGKPDMFDIMRQEYRAFIQMFPNLDEKEYFLLFLKNRYGEEVLK